MKLAKYFVNLVVVLVTIALREIHTQGCDVNCAGTCSSSGQSRCDDSCFGGYFLTQSSTCLRLANLALNKPAYQISTFSGNVASRAVDGNTTTDYSAGSCIFTNNLIPNPWWIVDLGSKYSVAGINVTSRGDYASDTSINNFIVGLTNDLPQPGQQVALYNYTLCGQYPNAVVAGTTVYRSCLPDLLPFRYVIIQTNSNVTRANYMTMCEVEVYGFECDPKCLDGCGRYGRFTCNRNCTTGYGISASHTCEACDPHCDVSVGCNLYGASFCDGKCTNGFGSTLSHNCKACDANCAVGCSFTGAGRCDGSCKSGYGISSTNTCLECDANCAFGCKTAGAGRCDEPCYEGYFLTANKTCAPLVQTATTTVSAQTSGGGTSLLPAVIALGVVAILLVGLLLSAVVWIVRLKSSNSQLESSNSQLKNENSQLKKDLEGRRLLVSDQGNYERLFSQPTDDGIERDAGTIPSRRDSTDYMLPITGQQVGNGVTSTMNSQQTTAAIPSQSNAGLEGTSTTTAPAAAAAMPAPAGSQPTVFHPANDEPPSSQPIDYVIEPYAETTFLPRHCSMGYLEPIIGQQDVGARAKNVRIYHE